MTKTKKGWTRRRFLEMVGIAGGSAAVYETMTALGLINIPAAYAGPPEIPQGTGKGKSVLILGAGIGGLTTAYLLRNAGYQVQILEAQNRAGGRSLTARQDTIITENSTEHGTTTQTCKFDKDLYLNMGPGRLPYHHRRVLKYCELLGVRLEIYVMATTANLFQTTLAFDGQPQARRRISDDTQGYVAELLAKAVRKRSLDEELTEVDREKLLSLLQTYGDLQSNYVYAGSTRSGCEYDLTVAQACEPETRLPLQYLLSTEFWKHRFYQPIDFEWQPTLFQPVGGMDKIVEGFKAKVGDLIQYETEVTGIRLVKDGGRDQVEVSYVNNKTGLKDSKLVDFCINNIPLPLLKKIPANFSDDFKKAVYQARFAPTCKVGWQANRRFWESNKNQIYGGISYIDDPITQMWYPSNDYFSAKGTLTGAYNYDQDAINLGKKSLRDRLEFARRGAYKLHPEFMDNSIVPIELGLSIAWQNVPFQHGGWAEWDDTVPEDHLAYSRLLDPDGRFYVIGDQVSPLPGWQEGAMMSAEYVVEQVVAATLLRVRPTRPEIRRAPNTRRVVQGRS